MKKETAKTKKEYYDSVYKPALIRTIRNTKNPFFIVSALSFVDTQMDKLYNEGGLRKIEESLSKLTDKISSSIKKAYKEVLEVA